MREIFDANTQRVPILAWLEDIEPGAMEQAVHLANLPITYHHVALMPDAHQGYGMPVGGVVGTDGYIIPNAVGVDIGCGMIARRTQLRAAPLQRKHKGQGTVLQTTLSQILRDVPVGLPPRGQHRRPRVIPDALRARGMRLLAETPAPLRQPLEQALERAAYQLGTLGSGNHFIEVQADTHEQVWLMLHSGSRALGKAICDAFNAAAKRRAEADERLSQVPKNWGLAALPVDDEDGRAYIGWMNLALDYAELNRALMMDRATEALDATAGPVTIEETIQTHHNYAALEQHFGKAVWLHRKGACRARAGELMIIPGSMETGSYIGRGKGNPESFTSCSHGAGRRMSRAQARKTRTVQDMVNSMQRKGIALATHRVDAVLDEAGHAYKDVESVIAQEADLVEPIVTLRPLGVVKG